MNKRMLRLWLGTLGYQDVGYRVIVVVCVDVLVGSVYIGRPWWRYLDSLLGTFVTTDIGFYLVDKGSVFQVDAESAVVNEGADR